jgi:5-methylthioadenosine/S-adenosylhomocysteine deaminase
VIGDKDYSLDLTEPGSDPLAGLSLATAIAKLTYGLANLPDLAAQALSPAGIAFEKVQSQARTIDFEMEEERDFGSLQSFALAVAPKLKPLAMAPITAVDDAQFIPTLKASRNLPAYVRNAL